MENTQIKVLLGFNLEQKEMDKDTEEKLRKYLLANGYDPLFITRRRKQDIIKFLKDNRDCNHAVLMESASDSIWTENELADLVDERNINLVLILTANKEKQLPYLTTLYAAGITSALFEKGGHGVAEEEVAEFLVRPRSRKAAREYYHIDTKNISIRTLTNEMFDGLCIQLADTEFGTCLMDRFLNVAPQLNPYQMEDFIHKLPERMRKELEQYAEFAQLIDQLKESGIRIKYKKPKVYRTINDEVPYVEHAKEQVRKKGLNTDMFEKPVNEKKGLFGKKAARGQQSDKTTATVPVAMPEMQGTPVAEEEVTRELIQSMSPFYDYEGEEEEVIEEEAEINLTKVRAAKQALGDGEETKEETKEETPATDTAQSDGDDDAFIVYY